MGRNHQCEWRGQEGERRGGWEGEEGGQEEGWEVRQKGGWEGGQECGWAPGHGEQRPGGEKGCGFSGWGR